MKEHDNNDILRFNSLYDYVYYYANSENKNKIIYNCLSKEDSDGNEQKEEIVETMVTKETNEEFVFREFCTGLIDYENLLKLILESENRI